MKKIFRKTRIFYLIEFFIVIIVTDRKCSVVDNVVLANVYTLFALAVTVHAYFGLFQVYYTYQMTTRGTTTLTYILYIHCQNKKHI